MTRYRPTSTELATASGRYIDILNPSPSRICIEDIAHALSQQARFNGHLPEFYSVAAHSVLVSHLIAPELALQGLLHDAAEAYLGDIISPLKRLLPEYLGHEAKMMFAICAALIGGETSQDFYLSICEDPRVKAADLQALALEQKFRSAVPNDDWGLDSYLDGSHPAPAGAALFCKAPKDAKAMFLTRFEDLQPPSTTLERTTS